MRCRGELVLILIVFLLSSHNIKAEISHKDFFKADENLHSIISFLDETLFLSNDILSNSLEVNCSINIIEKIEIKYNNKSIQNSLKKSDELREKLSYSDNIIEKIRNKASSYFYLKDFLIIIKNISINLSDFTNNHYFLINNFSALINLIKGYENDTDSAQYVSDIKFLISNLRMNVKNINVNLKGLNNKFEIANIEKKIEIFLDVLNKYESNIDKLLNLMRIEKTVLSLYLKEKKIYLGEEVNAFGYLIGDNAFIPNKTINIFFDNEFLDITKTDGFGRFDFFYNIPLETKPGQHNLSVSVIFNNSIFYSNTVNISFNKIPTNISLYSNRFNYYLNETISFFGRLTDYKNKGIKAEVFLYFNGEKNSLTTDQQGNFSFNISNEITFGNYSCYVSFNPIKIYDNVNSKTIKIFINTPTFLTINLSKNDIVNGEKIIINGRLISGIDNSPITNKTIIIILNENKIDNTNTDHDGFYSYMLNTEKLIEGDHRVKTIYTSKDIKWRSTSSKVIEISVKIMSEVFSQILMISIIIIFALIIIIFREKLFFFFKRSRLYPIKDFNIMEDVSKIKKTLDKKPDLKDYIIDINKFKSYNMNDSIIEKYRYFIILFLERFKSLKKGSTHLDIRREMLKKGFSRRATNIITKSFEYAMYSPYSFEESDILLFNKSMLIILKNIRSR